MKTLSVYVCVSSLFLVGICPVALANDAPAKKMTFKRSVRQLWTEHASCMKEFMTRAVVDDSDKEAAMQRLTQVQADICETVRPYYGDAAADQLAALLKGHAIAAGEIVSTVLQRDKKGLVEANKHWYDNSDAIADYLCTLNPKNWHKRSMRALLHEHVNLNAQEVVAILNGDPKNTDKFYDKLQNYVLEIADIVTRGIEKQFPDRFR